MVRALVAEVRRHPGIELCEGAQAHDLVTAGDRVVGVIARHASGRTVFHRAAAVVLATGGLGQLYARTTNPVEATGDGLAMAARAGAQLVDLEFIQFHPTALEASRDLSRRRRAHGTSSLEPLPLATDALRGEGAILIDDRGERFMAGVHPMAELGPRDVVARAIRRQQQAGRRVFLDAREAVGKTFPQRFPTVWDYCLGLGIDPRREPMPVTPAAHYSMAGIAVDASGRSSLPGLWACGEVASTGVHGANRLASNSLLEALVFGARVADDLGGSEPRLAPRVAPAEVIWREPGAAGGAGAGVRDDLRRLMWEHVGLERRRRGLEIALEEIEGLGYRLSSRPSETRNLLTVGTLVTAAAVAREESRGSHFRSDFPEPVEALRSRRFWTYCGVESGFPLVTVHAAPAAREIA